MSNNSGNNVHHIGTPDNSDCHDAYASLILLGQSRAPKIYTSEGTLPFTSPSITPTRSNTTPSPAPVITPTQPGPNPTSSYTQSFIASKTKVLMFFSHKIFPSKIKLEQLLPSKPLLVLV